MSLVNPSSLVPLVSLVFFFRAPPFWIKIEYTTLVISSETLILNVSWCKAPWISRPSPIPRLRVQLLSWLEWSRESSSLVFAGCHPHLETPNTLLLLLLHLRPDNRFLYGNLRSGPEVQSQRCPTVVRSPTSSPTTPPSRKPGSSSTPVVS